MIRWVLNYAPRWAALGLASLAVCVEACNDATDPGQSMPSFTVVVGTEALAFAAGQTATTSINVVRSGRLSGAIALDVSGAPAGITASVTPTAVADSSVLTLIASVAAGSATFPLVVTATAPGLAPLQRTITVTVTATGAPAIQSVVVGAHACALSIAGTAFCWGYNANGQLGDGDTSLVTPTPVTVAGGLRFQTLSVSKVEEVTCGLTDVGAAYCWGKNSQGQLGDGTTTRRLQPTPVAGGLTFRSIAVGNGHVCAVTTSDAAYCWGTSPNGALGEGSARPRLTPSPAAPGLPLQSVIAGSEFTCGLTPAGAAYCWGLGVFGQLGRGTIESSNVPTPVAGGLTFRARAAGGLAVCGLTMDRQAYCWGHNFYGTLGDGTSALENGTERRLTPVAVAGGLTFESISAGFETMCGVTTTGAGYCWGYNASGQLGDGSTTHRSTPVAIAGGLVFRSVSAGTGESCGVTTASVVYCWGDNSNGGLGDGTVVSRTTPVGVRWP